MTDTTPRPNILLVTIDSLRADYVYDDIASTPAIDSLTDEALVYKNGFSQGPYTTFSMPSLFTSRYPSGLGYLEFSDSTVGAYIEGEPTLPELLKEAGYETAGFHSNPLLSNLFGFDQGFDTFDARLPLSNTDWLSGRAKILADKVLRAIRTHAYLPAEDLTERAVDWLNSRDGDDPFFLWLHYMDVHGPYQSKSGNTYLNKYRGERLWRKAQKRPGELTSTEHDRIVDLYREEIRYTDACIGNLFDELRGRGLFDDTLTVLTADHGELFGEHGSYSHPHMLYDELTHVPLIVRDPNEEQRNVESVVELLDVAPTLVERADGTVPDSFAGERLPTDDTASDDDETPTAISEADLVPDYNGSVRTATYRYIDNQVEGTEELYRVDSNATEATNVADENPKKLAELRRRLEEHLADVNRAVGPDRDVVETDIDNDDVENRLEDLGYLQ